MTKEIGDLREYLRTFLGGASFVDTPFVRFLRAAAKKKGHLKIQEQLGPIRWPWGLESSREE